MVSLRSSSALVVRTEAQHAHAAAGHPVQATTNSTAPFTPVPLRTELMTLKLFRHRPGATVMAPVATWDLQLGAQPRDDRNAGRPGWWAVASRPLSTRVQVTFTGLVATGSAPRPPSGAGDLAYLRHVGAPAQSHAWRGGRRRTCCFGRESVAWLAEATDSCRAFATVAAIAPRYLRDAVRRQGSGAREWATVR
jgi:hypothetical protein